MKKLFALISGEGKSKEQLKEELWSAFLKHKKAEQEEDGLMVDVTEQEEADGTAYQIMGLPAPKKSRMRKNILLLFIFVVVALVGFYFLRASGQADISEPQITNQAQDESSSRPVSPEELRILQADPEAPAWLKDAESCTWVGEKIFCKLHGE